MIAEGWSIPASPTPTAWHAEIISKRPSNALRPPFARMRPRGFSGVAKLISLRSGISLALIARQAEALGGSRSSIAAVAIATLSRIASRSLVASERDASVLASTALVTAMATMPTMMAATRSTDTVNTALGVSMFEIEMIAIV